ncbi:MAG: phage DNA encapsidation protein, partial [Firmicutes bacterium]|nr:phage DNA encapsidation protein [Bacillota bacterium]
MKNNIYTQDGWLDVPALAARGCWLNVITGPRQVGKTYGKLKYIIEEKRPFILMRRTVEEVQFLGINTEVNPFKVFEPEHEISMDRAGKILNISEDGEIIGICLGLPTVATIRGFSASRFTDIIFDEFIPEKHVIQRKTEGDALLNAYTTINGNRELEGRPPVRLWLLANSNNINSPILTALGLVDPILRMREKGQEVFQKDGVLIVQPGSMKIIK